MRFLNTSIYATHRKSLPPLLMITQLPDSRVEGLLWTQTPFPIHGSIATLSPPAPRSRVPAAHAGPRQQARPLQLTLSGAVLHPQPRPWSTQATGCGPPQPSSSRQGLQTFRCTAATWETQKCTPHFCLFSSIKTIQNVLQEPDLSIKQPIGSSKHTDKP